MVICKRIITIVSTHFCFTQLICGRHLKQDKLLPKLSFHFIPILIKQSNHNNELYNNIIIQIYKERFSRNKKLFQQDWYRNLQEDRHKCEEFSCFCKLFAMVELFPVSKSSRLALISCLKWCSFQVMKKNKHALQKRARDYVKLLIHM